MDLGISGRRAIVCAASKGLGRACAIALANEGVHVTITARGAEALGKTAAHIRKLNPNVTVTEVVGDITTPEGREAALKACPDPDILIAWHDCPLTPRTWKPPNGPPLTRRGLSPRSPSVWTPRSGPACRTRTFATENTKACAAPSASILRVPCAIAGRCAGRPSGRDFCHGRENRPPPRGR